MRANQFTSAAEARAFILAGNAHVTLKSVRTGQRFTFRIRASEDGKMRFVSLLIGSDNENSYAYLGIIRGDDLAGFRTTAKSVAKADAPSAKAFAWVAGWLARGTLPAEVEVWHEGRCGRCGRMLTVPESLNDGLGPECKRIMRCDSGTTNARAAA